MYMTFLASNFFDKFCKLSFIDVHSLSFRLGSCQLKTNGFKAVEVVEPRLGRGSGVLDIFFDEFDFLNGDVIFVIASGLVLLSKLDNMAELTKNNFRTLGLSYFRWKTEAV